MDYIPYHEMKVPMKDQRNAHGDLLPPIQQIYESQLKRKFKTRSQTTFLNPKSILCVGIYNQVYPIIHGRKFQREQATTRVVNVYNKQSYTVYMLGDGYQILSKMGAELNLFRDIPSVEEQRVTW